MKRAIDTAGGQTQGQRADQEDCWRLQPFGADECAASLADGLGGHPAGDVASFQAVRVFHEHVTAERSRSKAPVSKWLEEAVIHADEHLRQLQVSDTRLEGMATTFVGVYVRGHELSAAAVGDSYLMLWRDGKLSRLNELHSEDGGVTSCVGFNLSRLDVADRVGLMAGDRLLLASDGILTLAEEEIAQILAQSMDANSAVRNLLEAVADAGIPHQDNTTVVAIFIQAHT